MLNFLFILRCAWRMNNSQSKLTWYNDYYRIAKMIIDRATDSKFPIALTRSFPMLVNAVIENKQCILEYADSIFPKSTIKSEFASCHYGAWVFVTDIYLHDKQWLNEAIKKATLTMVETSGGFKPKSNRIISTIISLPRGKRILANFIIMCIITGGNADKSFFTDCPFNNELYDNC